MTSSVWLHDLLWVKLPPSAERWPGISVDIACFSVTTGQPRAYRTNPGFDYIVDTVGEVRIPGFLNLRPPRRSYAGQSGMNWIM